MTTRTSNEIRDEIAMNGKALQQASADAALYDRLRAAAAAVPNLRKEADKLTADLAKAQDAEAKALKSSTVAKFEASNRGFRVDRIQHDRRTGLSHDRFVIAWERLCYDYNARDNLWQDYSVDGFDGLSDEVMDYILRNKPKIIPVDILALSPDDPFDAMSRYMAGKRRGYFR